MNVCEIEGTSVWLVWLCRVVRCDRGSYLFFGGLRIYGREEEEGVTERDTEVIYLPSFQVQKGAFLDYVRNGRNCNRTTVCALLPTLRK